MTLDLSQPWHTLPIAVVDTESTGIGDDARVVEIACVRYESGCPVARWSSLINPGVPIPEEATKVHGITDDMVKGAPCLTQVAGDILRVAKGAVPCAYNAPYDRRLLHAEITGTDCLAFDPGSPWIDVLVIVRDIDKYVGGQGRHKLVNACARRGIEITGAHRALADALATGGLLWTFKNRLGDMSAAKLLARTEARRAAQEAEFQAYRARLEKETANG